MRIFRPSRLLLPLVAWALATCPGTPSAQAHVVETRDGRLFEGRIVSEDDDEVVIETTFDGTQRIPLSEVARIDRMVPPLRQQLAYRLERAEQDVSALWDVYRWAEPRGFERELVSILDRILELAPEDGRARRLLGHERVDGRWMSPDEKVEYLRRRAEEEMRARGLVPYEGRWVTPEEKDALERGLLRDGDEWVTEEEYHRRRGEVFRDGAWIRLGEAEGTAWGAEVASAARLRLGYRWGPHFDVYYDVRPALAEKVLEGAERAYAVMRETLRPQGRAYPEVLEERIRLVLLHKLPAYARFVQWFDATEQCSELVPGWGRAVLKQHSFWWVDPVKVTGVYMFPNVSRTFVSNAVHNVGLILITRYRFNYRFPPTWLLEGFAYYLEMEALGYSDSFTLGRGGTVAGAGERPAWADSDKWRSALQGLVAEGRDPPLRRIARMGPDQMGYEELVKCWSVVECLVRWDAARFRAFVDGAKERDADIEEALAAAYMVDWRGLDDRWRAYVSAGFRHP